MFPQSQLIPVMASFNYTKLYFTAGQLRLLYHTLNLGKHKTLQQFLGNLYKMRSASSIQFPTDNRPHYKTVKTLLADSFGRPRVE